MKIVLVGYMGSGKSSIGKKLAEVVKLPFMDLDSEIEKTEGIAVSEIFSQKGEIYFRNIENKILKKVLDQPDNFILATGGGTPCYGDSMDYILKKQGVVSIYLRTPLKVLVSRLMLEKDERPLLIHINTENELEDFIRKHLFERAFYYNQAAVTIDVVSESITETVAKIILKLF
ncbi:MULTISPECIES: shikimate kinase [Aequorivita]|uniref:Shikimate kinase n=1 Tax=Aequorivita iocasae TaxID=2803865 RepID=A0ABX7DNK7_9FLAO|nr:MULTISPECIES: shikimate kinase [Aequorivita]QQX75696.1 shikimate kinase [Aequorivita iocasae]UCA55153.1 shikimate kinase [Aequorivita sp. F7]